MNEKIVHEGPDAYSRMLVVSEEVTIALCSIVNLIDPKAPPVAIRHHPTLEQGALRFETADKCQSVSVPEGRTIPGAHREATITPQFTCPRVFDSQMWLVVRVRRELVEKLRCIYYGGKPSFIERLEYMGDAW